MAAAVGSDAGVRLGSPGSTEAPTGGQPGAWRVAPVVAVAACAVAVGMAATVSWLLTTWGEVHADEIAYHLQSSLEGTNPGMVIDALLRCVLPALVAVVALCGAMASLRRRPRAANAVTCCAIAASVAIVGMSLARLERDTGLVSYAVESRTGSRGDDFIASNYVDPQTVGISFPDRPRNLVYIYLESVEMTFSDTVHGGAFERDVIPQLTQLAQEGEDFSGTGDEINGAVPLPGTGWTMGGIFAQSTGLPLKVPFDGNLMASQDDFFPGVTALGDILASHGYNQVFLLGSDATFGGRRLFFEGHGGYEIHDYPYAQKAGLLPEGYHVFWGYEDERLFEFARQELTDLAGRGEPFNLTLLTVDTHFEDGYVCRLCVDDFGEQYANVMACSSRQVFDFVRWVQEQDFYQDTTIVICGDHRTMDSNFVEWLDGSYLRRTLTTVINGAVTPQDPGATRAYSTFDLFPTTLAALGADIAGDRLGLGTNLYSGRETLLERYGDDVYGMLSGPSDFLQRLGEFSFGEDVLAQMEGQALLRSVEGEGDSVTLILQDVPLRTSYVTGAAVLVTDPATGEATRYEMEVVPVEGNPDYFWCRAASDLSAQELEGLSFTALISTEACTDYPICTGLG